MLSRIRVLSVIFVVLTTVLFFACSSSKPQVETEPAPVATPTPVPSVVVSEEVVTEPPTQPVVSEHPGVEELPEDLVILNARGYLEDVFFATDRYELGQEAREHLATNATWLRQYPTVAILVEGHCDERNTREYNLALGERRANAVRDYLIFMGVDAHRIRTISYGEERPFSQGHDEATWQLNRRSHFVITAR